MNIRSKQDGLLVAGLVMALVSAGCGAHRVPPRQPVSAIDDMARDAWAAAMSRSAVRTPGSLWQDGGLGERLMADTRAARVGDLLTVHIVESTEGTNEADSALGKSSTNDFGVPELLGVADNVNGNINSGFSLSDLFETNTQKNFTGSGSTTRSSSLLTTVTGRIFRVFPNGNMAILGRKEVTVNREHQVLWLVGLVRPEDIDELNSLESTRIAEMSLLLTGSGDISDVLREGWFTRWLSRVWPF